jgi:hypothetical protein
MTAQVAAKLSALEIEALLSFVTPQSNSSKSKTHSGFDFYREKVCRSQNWRLNYCRQEFTSDQYEENEVG